MTSPLKGKVALVTGATRGIGKGIALALSESGATVYITGRSLNAESATDPISGSLEDTQTAAGQLAGTIIACQIDHSKDNQVQQLFQQIKTEQNGQLDLLVNNVYGGVRALREQNGKPFWKADASLWDACNNVGLRSHYIASRLAAQMMVPRKQGLIITISSWGGLAPIFGVAYGTGKSACDRLAAEMALELKPHNIASIALWPGIVGTEHISELIKENIEEINAQTTNTNSTTDPQLTPQLTMMSSQFNWETPTFTGRVIAALLGEPNIMRFTGKLQIVAELAAKYKIQDLDDAQPASLRSLKFLLPTAIPVLQNYTAIIPNILIPWWLMLLTALRSPQK
ncbi:MAG: SDR family NAD(P)-dependent oxidoreductase [Cyanobacteria bacterium J06621_11]